ncbi:MAG: hypothetical protein II968_07525 [Selenomonadaceae bacterium]|nr:hypothetical protein [Selenomonadaceae bacterium]MBQ4495603.1 hypothetical protein [Selenomonadaceae bacterium]MBQ6758848.1 hypothetical protein [Selenomonadaceae bacterium]MBR0102156.1 hypothetical protein [Selenomonadaceae bacterium]
MIVRRIIYKGQKPTPEQIEEIKALKDRPIVFDEDCPELTDEELKQFRRVNPRRKEKAVS